MGGEPNQVLWRGVQPVEGISGIWPSRNAERVTGMGYQTGVGTDLVYTVAADKRLFISCLQIGSRLSVDAAAQLSITHRDAADLNTVYLAYHMFYVKGQQNTHHPYIPALELGPSFDLLLYSTTAELDGRLMFHGWLEDV